MQWITAQPSVFATSIDLGLQQIFKHPHNFLSILYFPAFVWIHFCQQADNWMSLWQPRPETKSSNCSPPFVIKTSYPWRVHLRANI